MKFKAAPVSMQLGFLVNLVIIEEIPQLSKYMNVLS